ncbi:MAG: UPF0147 family protein [Candidatus Altiarchaeota archaeon]|nr:UPF0147 family protein [Candidatus Altiarchaeota archaeon]
MSSEMSLRLDEAIKDTSIPRRVKLVLERVKADIASTKKDKDINITTAVYELDEIVNDVNIPMHAKTIIWDVISALESLKGS